MATAKEMCNTSPPLWDLESERVLRIQLFSIEPILGTYLSSGVGMKLILGGGGGGKRGNMLAHFGRFIDHQVYA